MDSIKADHGYNLDSKSVRNLLTTMSQYTPEERRDFLQFITGSPKLPIGGKHLKPTTHLGGLHRRQRSCDFPLPQHIADLGGRKDLQAGISVGNH